MSSMRRFLMKTKTQKLFNERGSLLIETILAVVILSFCLTVIIRSMLTSLKATTATRDYMEAVFTADSKMGDYLKTLAADENIMAGEDSGSSDSFSEKTKFRPKVEINTPANDRLGEESVVKELKLSLSWNAGQKEKKMELSTYLLGGKEQ